MKLIERLNPATTKRGLFMVAAIVWTIAGLMLMSRAVIGSIMEGKNILLILALGISLGILFYLFMFSSISSKHLKRISEITNEKPSMFSFFNARSYMMMVIMISGGVSLRLLDIINHQVLFVFYITMGFPLFISAIRFYRAWWRTKSINN